MEPRSLDPRPRRANKPQLFTFAALLLASVEMPLAARATPMSSTAAARDAAGPAASTTPTPTSQDLSSRPAFDTWLAIHWRSTTPLDMLSPGARERFLSDLSFGERGIGGVGTDDLGRELTQPQIDTVLTWLGLPPGLVRSRIDVAASTPGAGGPRQPVTNAAITATERQVNDFLRLSRESSDPPLTPQQRAQRTARLYDTAFPRPVDAAALRGLRDADIVLLQRAAAQASYDARHPPAIDALQALMPIALGRGVGSDRDLQDLQNPLLRARRFDAARALQAAHPEAKLDTIPQLRDGVTASVTAPTVWRVRDSGSVLERERIDLRGTRLVVTAGCHFSQDAATDIARDPDLGPAFARHATWLMAPPGSESIDAVLD